MTTPKLPAFESLLKSRDVEDPVNLWVHRPLAYAFVALIYRTPLTPNAVTLMAMLVGVTSGALWFQGEHMVVGGVLLWASAILDGADGILARAKQQFSEMGRALDGAADTVVALATVSGAFYHLWITRPGLHGTLAWMIPAAVVSAVLHIELYDYYKESYMQMTNPAWGGHPERLDKVEARLPRLRAEGAGPIAFLATHLYIGLVTGQARVVGLTNPWGLRHRETFTVTPESAESYRRHNRLPMRLWAMISLAPHSYLMAICGMLDRLDLYLWIRLGVMNGLFVVVLLWQRASSRAHREDLARLGIEPVAYSPAP